MEAWHDREPEFFGRFLRRLTLMGRLLRSKRERAANADRAHPLLELVAGDVAVTRAIGAVQYSDEAQKGVLTWASIRLSKGYATLRLSHKGTLKNIESALDAAKTALRLAGRRVSFHDLIRLPDQNSYVALLRVPDAAPALGLAR